MKLCANTIFWGGQSSTERNKTCLAACEVQVFRFQNVWWMYIVSKHFMMKDRSLKLDALLANNPPSFTIDFAFSLLGFRWADSCGSQQVRASYLQIYNEVISDLLKPDRSHLMIRRWAGVIKHVGFWNPPINGGSNGNIIMEYDLQMMDFPLPCLITGGYMDGCNQ